MCHRPSRRWGKRGVVHHGTRNADGKSDRACREAFHELRFSQNECTTSSTSTPEPVVAGDKTIEQMGEDILDLVIEVASGEVRTKAEQKAQEDFIPWKRGVSL